MSHTATSEDMGPALVRGIYISMRARRDGYRRTYQHLKDTHPQKEVFKQLTLELTHWTEAFERAFPVETKL